jgi:hypothetical protein
MMCIEHDSGVLKGRFKELGKLNLIKARLPTTMMCCCHKLHNVLLAFKEKTLEEIFSECNISTTLDDEDNDNRRPHMDMLRATEAMIEERTLFEGKVTRGDILDYLVHMQNDRHRRQYRL